jgi:hypothetical protein
MTEPERYQSFAEFWPFYVREHANAANRRMHVIGSLLVIAIAVVAVVTARWWLLLALPIAGYGFAWVGHFVLQKNRPATFTYPVWSFLADFKMLACVLTGRMDAEVERATSRIDTP